MKKMENKKSKKPKLIQFLSAKTNICKLSVVYSCCQKTQRTDNAGSGGR